MITVIFDLKNLNFYEKNKKEGSDFGVKRKTIF